ncbi:MAG TPA: hypothetical protein VJZ01_06815 [Lachnospiraceae bacterium]|jgi:cation transport ATPase|nr:hypothetical protein [Lachnospiraceae bacterium]
MAWCPICKNEYKEGITECSDCGATLVESLETNEKTVIMSFGEEAYMNKLYDFLVFSKITSAETAYANESGLYEVSVSKDEEKEAKKLANIFAREEAKAAEEKVFEEQEDLADDMLIEDEPKQIPEQPYVKAEEKAENYKSSAYALILVGAIGLIAIILIMLGIIPLSLAANIRVIAYVVLTLMFVIFLVVGVHSMKEAKRYSKEAEEENDFSIRIKEWFIASYPDNTLNDYMEELIQEDDTDEIKYFKRTGTMRTLISENFEELEPAFMEKIIDELYQELFEA